MSRRQIQVCRGRSSTTSFELDSYHPQYMNGLQPCTDERRVYYCQASLVSSTPISDPQSAHGE
eukprot:10683200-Prorocentrum_lima.AAC.1